MPRITPATYTLRVPQRATLEESMVLKASGQPLNLTGYTVLASIYKLVQPDGIAQVAQRGVKIADLTVVYVNRAAGSIKLRLDRGVTRTITESGYWDLLVIEPGGDADYWLEGPATLDIGLTDNV